MTIAPLRRVDRAIDVLALRSREFPWLADDRTAYLNSASTGPTPASTLEAIESFARQRARPHRITQAVQFGTTQRARELCARLVGAEADEIALGPNTSFGLNLAARALPLREGNVVVTSEGEFPANVYPWLALERARGVTTRLVPCVGRLPDEDALLAALDEPRVRLLALSWVGFATGARVDLERLGRACRERGIWFVVDAIQGVGAAPLDVRAGHVDVLACGAQKWLLSPWGTGFAYVRRELVRELEPPAAGWISVRDAEDFGRLTDYDLTWRDDARRFEVGTLPHQDYAALNASVGLLLELGVEAVAAHVEALVGRVVAWAEANPRCARLVTSAEPARRAGIVSLAPQDLAAAVRRLDVAGVVYSAREGMIRLSPHCFNTTDDVDVALRALEG